MTTLREAAEKVRHALERFLYWDENGYLFDAYDKLHEALVSKTVPSDCSDSHQPDAWRTEARNEHGLPVFFCASEVKQAGPGLIPLYTTPPQRKPLTDAEIFSILKNIAPEMKRLSPGMKALVQTIEAAIKARGEE